MRNYADSGIVLHSMKYSESQLIVHVLTCQHGRQSYIIRVGSRGNGRNLFQPFQPIDFQATAGKGELHKLSQVTATQPLTDIPFNIVKSTMALFLAEVLYRVVKSQADDPRFYEFVYGSVVTLDLLGGSVANFHLHFMVRLAYYMGFAPQGRYAAGMLFDIKTGEYTSEQPRHTLYFDSSKSALLRQLYESNIEQAMSIELNRSDRTEFLDLMVDLYGYNTDSIYSVNSIAMFRELF